MSRKRKNSSGSSQTSKKTKTSESSELEAGTHKINDVNESYDSDDASESSDSGYASHESSDSISEEGSVQESQSSESSEEQEEQPQHKQSFGSNKQARSLSESHRLFLGRLPRTTTHEEVKEYFSQYGDVEWVKLLRFPDTKKPTGAGFIAFREESSVQSVIDATKGSGKIDFYGTLIRITKSDEKPIVTKRDRKREEKKNDVRSVYVGNLAWKTTEKAVLKHFKDIGKIKDIKIPILKANKKPRGFAIIEFVDEASIEKAVQQKNGSTLDGRVLKVESMNKSS